MQARPRGLIPWRPGFEARIFLRIASTNVTLSAVGLTSGLLLAHALAPAARGDLALVLALVAVLQQLAACGLRNATAFHVAKRPTAAQEIMNASNVGTVGSTTIAFVAGIAGVLIFQPSAAMVVAFAVALVSTPFDLWAGTSKAFLMAVDRKRWNDVRMVQPLSYALLILVLTVTVGLSTQLAALAFTLAIAIASAAAYWVGPRTRLKFQLFRGPRESLRTLYWFGFRSMLGQSAAFVNLRADILVLGLLVEREELGVYAVAASLAQYVVPISTASAPWLFQLVAGGSEADKSAVTIRRGLAATIAIATVAAIVATLTAPAAIPLVLGSEWEPAIPALRILLFASVANSSKVVLSAAANAIGKPQLTAGAELAAAVLTAVLVWPAVRQWGIEGAALVSFGAYTVSALYLWRRVFAGVGDHQPTEVVETL